MKAERGAGRWDRRKGKYREHSNLLDPPIEALDKATASTKISGEQCTWPDSDRVKCHRLPPPSLRPSWRSARRVHRRSLVPDFAQVLATFLLLPSVLFFPPVFSFSRDRDRGRRVAAIRDRRTRRKLLGPSLSRRDAEDETVLDRRISRSFFIALVRDAYRRCMCLSIATKHDRLERAPASPVVDPFLPLTILAILSFSQLALIDRPSLLCLPFSYPIAKLIASIFSRIKFPCARRPNSSILDYVWIICAKFYCIRMI